MSYFKSIVRGLSELRELIGEEKVDKMAKITDEQMQVMINIIGAVETGGQVYGQRRYDDFTEAFANSPGEKGITVGGYQEYCSLAKGLLKDILQAYPDVFRKYDNAGIEADLNISNWETYRPTKNSVKAKAIQKIISTKEGIEIQDRRIIKQISEYVDYAVGLGVTDADALLMCANFSHQGGNSACKRIVGKTKRPYTLDNLYAASQTDTGTQVGAYKSRQKMVYESLKKYVTPYMSKNTEDTGGDKMTRSEIIDKVVNTALFYVGYLEKASNANLDDFTANAGMNNYTRFARDYQKYTGENYQGQAWCAMFVSTIMVEAVGLENAKKLLGGGLFAYTPTGASQMKAKAGVHPKKGDVVFFYSSSMGRISHVGLVTGVDGSRFYTVEGNTSGAEGVVRNGGGVFKKSYSLGYANARFATPPYEGISVSAQSGSNSSGSASNGKSALGTDVKWIGKVTADALNVRTWPGANNALCSFGPLTDGELVKVCDTVKANDGVDWYYIEYNGLHGFVHSSYVKKDEEGSKLVVGGIDYSPVFSAKYYTNHNEDVKKAFGMDEDKLFEHFQKYGMKEGRQAKKGFNVKVYKNRYLDLQRAFGDDLPSYYKHYCQYGYNEGRNGK